MKYLLQFAFIAIMSQLVHAQDWEKKSKNDLSATNWVALSNLNNLTIEYKSSACNPGIGYEKENILLRFTNT